MNTEKKYKTQGTISSVSIETDGRTSFTIDPVEPYDFPVKKKGETKKYILFQPASEERRNGGIENDIAAKANEQFWKVKPDTIFSIPGGKNNPEKESCPTFGDMISLKQNRSAVEFEVNESEFTKDESGKAQENTASSTNVSDARKTVEEVIPQLAPGKSPTGIMSDATAGESPKPSPDKSPAVNSSDNKAKESPSNLTISKLTVK